jgi:4-aminobutyrate aminotransferase
VLVKAFKRGVAVIDAGFSTIRIAPPLVIPREMALKAASIILEVLRGYR